jgi:fatty-acyl-CoA synthase
MFGLMQDWPLTVDRFLEHAGRAHGDRQVVSRRQDGRIERRSYAAILASAKRISNALIAHGIGRGDRIATLGFNGGAHLEAWYAIAGIGAVCHTLNPRMSLDQLIFIVQHAGDRILFADAGLGALAAELERRSPALGRVVLFDDLPQFTAGRSSECRWGDFDERSAAGLCYTSGTTGDPKGVLYSHRSNFLHTLMILQSDVIGFSVHDSVLPVVPMYHANAWGLTFAAPAVGARLVMPGPRLDGASVYELIEGEGVTLSAGVPTVWLALLEYVRAAGLRFSTLRRLLVGGAACPERLIRDFRDLGVDVIHAWGMTEMSPVGSVGTLTPEIAKRAFEAQMPWRIKQGRAPFGIEFKLVDAAGTALPHDGVAVGALCVRGPAVVAAYFRDSREILDADGFFDTGDIASIDGDGYMRITDRSKDVIKSGGEWISSLGIENAALMHPALAGASVVAIADAKWGERPVLLAILKPGCAASATDLREFLAERMPTWHVPDQVLFVTEYPLGPTGKVDKRRLREFVARGAIG